ncbi:NAD(P)-binding protein [Myriangium duriaei CBS 260.36]|uniref:NAD(P)-binding protein n=1 Tax=Myriangium duriaei CBS 260.36 TaxID=1168546 RepID=A0A9P4MSA5_9PEZI|nr:NAD(P)-binding protein [Myriangium duriaei CBS 260.36]
MVAFEASADIPSLTGKTILVTGGTSGLGKETLFLLGPHSPSKLIFTGRNIVASENIIAEFQSRFPSVSISFVRCDLASLGSVQKFARQVLASNQQLDLVFAIAGVMAVPAALTEDGYEVHFGVNHMAHALLFKLLMPLLERTAAATPSADVRIISYSSDASRSMAPDCGIDFDTLHTTQDVFYIMGEWRRFAQSKLANAIYARALAHHHPELLAVSIHPGIAMTASVENLPFMSRMLVTSTTYSVAKSPMEVAMNGLWAATSPRADGRGVQGEGRISRLGTVENGTFYRPIGELDTRIGLTQDDDLTTKLWDWTEQELKAWSV